MKKNDKKITGCGILFPSDLMVNGCNQESGAVGLQKHVY